MRAHLNSGRQLADAATFLHEWRGSEEGPLLISCDDTCEQVHPVVAATLSCQIVEARTRGIAVTAPPTLDLGWKVRRLGLSEYLGIADTTEEVLESSGAWIPVTQVRTEEQAADVMTDMVPLLHASAAQADAVHYVISELVRNVLEHSYSATGAFFSATHDASTGRIAVGVADGGRGVRESMSRNHVVRDDREALLLAMRPGVSGTTRNIGGTSDNAGLGLFYTKAIASSSSGDFLVASGDAQFHWQRRVLCTERSTLIPMKTKLRPSSPAAFLTAPRSV